MTLDLDRLEALTKEATPGPWFYNSYSAIFSTPKIKTYDEWFDTIPEGHTVERYGSCPACGDWKAPTACGLATPASNHGCRYFDEDYKRDPLVAHVPSHHGDTAIGRRAKDAELIEAAVNALPLLLEEVRQLREQVAAVGEANIHLNARLGEVKRERDLAVAHDRQPYPTAHAYEAACRALEKHRQDAKLLAEERDQVLAICATYDRADQPVAWQLARKVEAIFSVSRTPDRQDEEPPQ